MELLLFIISIRTPNYHYCISKIRESHMTKQVTQNSHVIQNSNNRLLEGAKSLVISVVKARAQHVTCNFLLQVICTV